MIQLALFYTDQWWADDEAMSEAMGKVYSERKKERGNPTGANQHSEESGHSDHIPTREQVANEFGTSEKSVRRAEKLADGLAHIEAVDPEAANAIRTSTGTPTNVIGTPATRIRL